MSNFKKTISNLLIILIIGGLGGILADYFILPYLADFPLFASMEFIQRAKNGTTIVNRTEEIIIIENTAIEEAIRRINRCLVVVNGRGSGIIITNDGLILTASDLVAGEECSISFSDNSSLSGKVIRRDNNLALIRVEANNLPVVALAGLDSLNLGQRIILIGARIDKEFSKFVNIGTIRSISPEILTVNLEEKNSSANGGPLINIKGEVIGLNMVNKNGLIRTIPADTLSDFFIL